MQVLDLKDKIRDALKKMMEDADWMDETTRQRAIDKVVYYSLLRLNILFSLKNQQFLYEFACYLFISVVKSDIFCGIFR